MLLSLCKWICLRSLRCHGHGLSQNRNYRGVWVRWKGGQSSAKWIGGTRLDHLFGDGIRVRRSVCHWPLCSKDTEKLVQRNITTPMRPTSSPPSARSPYQSPRITTQLISRRTKSALCLGMGLRKYSDGVGSSCLWELPHRMQQQDNRYLWSISKDTTISANVWYRYTDLIASYLLIRDTGRYATTKLLILIQQCSTHTHFMGTEPQRNPSELVSDFGQRWAVELVAGTDIHCTSEPTLE